MTDLYVKGPVLAPGWIGRPEMGITDRPLTAKEIQKAAYSFLPGTPIVDRQHDFKKQAEVVESYIAPEVTHFNGKDYPAGTWFLTSKITDPNLKEEVTNGTLQGYSVGAFPEEFRDKLMAKGMFSDVEEGEWLALAVSLVTMPFYPEAIFKVFGPDDFIKKSFNPTMEVDKLTNENENGAILLLRDMFNHIIKKESSAVETPQYSNELEDRVTELKRKVDELTTENEKLTAKVEKQKAEIEELKAEPEEPEEEPEKPSEESEEDEQEESEEESIEDEAITKSLNIDDQKKTKTNKSFMNTLNRDPMGRNKKYL